MTSGNSSSNSGSIGFFGLLGLLFIGLKLTGHVAWPWLWVLAPLWIPFAFVAALFVGVLLVFIVVEAVKSILSIRPRWR